MTVLTRSYAFAFGGIEFGGAQSPYQILSVDGLEGLPGLRTQDDNRGYADGMFSGRDFYAGRTISIIFQTFGSSGNSAQDNFNIIQSYLLPQTSGTTPLYFLLPPNDTQFINARVRALKTTVDANYTYGFITSQVDFFCPNPCYFSNVTQTITLAYTSAAGRTYDRVYDLVYGSNTGYKSGTVINNGWATAYPLITIHGPITNPIVGNLTTGQSLSFNCILNSSDVLVIDLYNKLITLNGLPARNLLTGGVWFGAPAGNSVFYINGNFTVDNVTYATIEWNSTYV